MQWFSQAPSNIALIKYMGKEDEQNNLPANPSLSYTLKNLISSVQLESTPMKRDVWEPLNIPGAMGFELAAKGQQRFLHHLDRIKRFFDYRGNFIVRSTNNFPHSSGLASSASSFAALTKCAILAIADITKSPLPSAQDQVSLSRMGSGSSCRSFYGPWALWQGETVKPVKLPYTDLLHQVVVISHDEKAISSSQAHRLITSSHHYPGRAARAQHNLNQLVDAFNDQDWAQAYDICWREFQDMHNLFTTASQSFEYMTPQSKEVLLLLQKHWEKHGDGPLVTMDAGPNIHLLYRNDQQEVANQFRHDHLTGNFDVI